jgi:hypothetical protein
MAYQIEKKKMKKKYKFGKLGHSGITLHYPPPKKKKDQSRHYKKKKITFSFLYLAIIFLKKLQIKNPPNPFSSF